MDNLVPTTRPSERRTTDRHTYCVEVSVELGGVRRTAMSINVSAGGMRLDLPESVEIGETMKLSFRLAALDAPVEATAVVRWRDRIDPRCCGVQFTTGLRAREVYEINELGKL